VTGTKGRREKMLTGTKRQKEKKSTGNCVEGKQPTRIKCRPEKMSTGNNVEWKRPAKKKSAIQLVLEAHVAHVRLFQQISHKKKLADLLQYLVVRYDIKEYK
jgi:hypothetical protein